MDLFLEITNIWKKSGDFWFADFFLEIFKKADMDIPMDFGCFESFHQNIKKKLTKKRATSKIWTKWKKVNTPPPPQEKQWQIQ